MKTFNTAHPITELPEQPDHKEGYSDDLLIDIDGWRKNFTVGHYDFDEKRWYIHNPDLTIESTAMWQYLPLAKYEDQ